MSHDHRHVNLHFFFLFFFFLLINLSEGVYPTHSLFIVPDTKQQALKPSMLVEKGQVLGPRVSLEGAVSAALVHAET